MKTDTFTPVEQARRDEEDLRRLDDDEAFAAQRADELVDFAFAAARLPEHALTPLTWVSWDQDRGILRVRDPDSGESLRGVRSFDVRGRLYRSLMRDGKYYMAQNIDGSTGLAWEIADARFEIYNPKTGRTWRSLNCSDD